MLKTLYKLFLNSFGISIDTRTIQENQIYFALKGDNFDGNKYAEMALEKGALCVVVDDASVLVNKQDKPYFLVSDVLDTLQRLAKYHREVLNIPIIGITGTNGKTTTKELILAVLSEKYNVFATYGNLNNHIGVPLSLLSITEEHDMAIIEMGANHQGEIAILSRIAQPNYGLITNIGKAHLEGFESVEGILKTKKELFDFVSEHNGTFFYNLEEDNIHRFANTYGKTCTYSNTKQESDVFYTNIHGKIASCISIGEEKIQSNLFGDYNAQNLAAAYTVGNYFDVPVESIKKGLETYTPQNNRSQIVQTDKNELVVDAYNANPTSLGLAINQFLDLNHNHKVIVVGDMFELGEYSEAEHQEIVNILTERNADFEQAYLVGEHFSATTITHNKITAYTTRTDLETYFTEQPVEDKLVLLKASRGIGLEQVVKLL